MHRDESVVWRHAEFGRSEHGDDAGHRSRLAGVYRQQPAVSDVGPGEHRMQRTLELQIGEVATGAEEECRILGAQDAGAEQRSGPGLIGRRHRGQPTANPRGAVPRGTVVATIARP